MKNRVTIREIWRAWRFYRATVHLRCMMECLEDAGADRCVPCCFMVMGAMTAHINSQNSKFGLKAKRDAA